MVIAPSATAPGAPRPGMVWVPAGVLRAGSDPEDVPRVADAELPGVETPLAGFYVDALPWPNEPGAIATTNMTRDEARKLCETKGKRLCSELEWERACKGPDNARYEFGATFDPRVCGGAAAGQGLMRPCGQRSGCRSAFGARDLHGGPAEWTDSPWGRGGPKGLGVVRGGGEVPGELTSRCAFARSADPAERSPVVGFRCCAGPRNDAEVELTVKHGAFFERTPDAIAQPSPSLEALSGASCGPPRSPAPCSIARAWTWRPTPNVELYLSGGCVGHDPSARCGVGLSRAADGQNKALAQIDTGREIPEVVLVDCADHRVRVRGADMHSIYFREVVFDHGRIDVRPVR